MSPPSSDSPMATRRSAWFALGGVAIASFLGCIDFTIVNTALPAIQTELGADLARLQWVMTAFVMALSSCTIAIGQLADCYGRARIMQASMAVFALASLGAGLSHDLAALIAWRILQGAACAGLYTASAALVAEMFAAQERGKALGLLFSANGVGLAVGPVLGGLLAGTLGWRWIFFLNLPLILASFMLCWRRLPAPAPGTSTGIHFDWAGTVLWLALLPGCLLLLSDGSRWGWLSARSLSLTGSCLLLGLALWRTERHAAAPLLRFALFLRPRFLSAAVATAALACFYCVAFFLMPLYLSELRHQDSIMTGWLLLPTTALMALTSPLVGRISDQRGTGPVMGAGFLALLLSALIQATFGPDTRWAWVLLAFASLGIGWACLLGPSMNAALAALPGHLAGTALGMAATLHNLGGALGLALATALYDARASSPHPTPEAAFLAGYHAVMLMLAGISLAALLLLRLTPSRAARR
ncbi:DHA2 family efflux MFS transporter permease subunit [Kerstersia similis]|uniref:DHA2 family efflux MFS transporter permease subunit n=1 Tax=Kerstersia similis TaxID=206505 RepID=UPI0039EF9FB7